jgi:hypothetical protein
MISHFKTRFRAVTIGLAALILVAVALHFTGYEQPVLPVQSAVPSDQPARSANAPAEGMIAAENPSIQDMARKGLPIPSNPRQYILDSTVNQSLEDCIQDLGNRFTLAFGPVNTPGGMDELPSWGRITYHSKMLRVIEEGRRSPDKVVPLLLAELHRSLADPLEKLEEEYEKVDFHTVMTSDHDPKYAAERQYSNIVGEYPRRMDSIGQCLWALGNIHELSAAKDELASFSQTKLHKRPLSFEVVLITFLVNECQSKGQHVDPELVTMTKNIQLTPGVRSAWNAIVDIHDPMAGTANLDITGVRTLEVIGLPTRLPDDVTKEIQEEIVSRFAAYVRGQK